MYNIMSDSSNKPEDNSAYKLETTEVIKRAFKYLIEGLVIAIAAKYIPKQELKLNEILMIAITGAAVFAILDLFAPAVGQGARQGAGFIIGAKTFGLALPTAAVPML